MARSTCAACQSSLKQLLSNTTPSDAFMACAAAVASMGLAGEWALAETNGRGTGSLHTGIIDALSRIGDAALAEQGKVRYETLG